MTLEEKIENYHMSSDTAELVRETKLLLIAGIVGGGKNTVINELLKGSEYHEIVSHTTRLPRNNHGIIEMDGVDYHFITPSEAEQLIKDQAFVEVKYVHGNVYGTSAAELEAAHGEGKIAVTDIDIKGVVEYLDIKPDTHAVFLLPPSVETWLARLERRYGNLEEHNEEIEKRLRTAKQEIEFIQQDERFILVVNDDLETTVERIEQIVAGERDHTSDFALTIAEHLLEYISHRLDQE
jgi:guanylate kinase